MGFREEHCKIEKFIVEHVDDRCWQYDYILHFFSSDEEAMLLVCAKCIYFKGDKMFDYAMRILKDEHIRLLAEEPFSKYITKLEQAIELLKKGEKGDKAR